ncbi:hypothetical protein PIB30_052795 [Stylosanthes scabra]|uniref:Uncharacterized protein n=1 Tax=Stylosanthes scabra TaxID=79078 RepID=A0ABU6UIP2_9FABA|nr:hypothetical protein [Stylosanthes scabra]
MAQVLGNLVTEPGAESRTPSNTCSKCDLNPELWPARDKVLSELQRTKASPPERACHSFGAIAKEAFDSDTQSSSSISGTSTMAERVTLKQLGGVSTAFDNQPNRFPELNANFQLKNSVADRVKTPSSTSKDFEVISATTRRTDGDDDVVKAFALLFSLDDRAKD